MEKVLIPVGKGFTRSVLGTCRVIGSNYEVYILSQNQFLKNFQKLLKTKYCFKYDFCADSMKNPEEFVSQIKKYVKNNSIDIILPFGDSEASLLSYYKDEIDAQTPLPSYDIFQKAMDKYQITKVAKNLNIPVPKSIEVSDYRNIKDLLKDNNISYPFVLKPKIRGDNLLGTKIIHSKRELMVWYQKFSSIGTNIPLFNYRRPIIQEFLGEGTVYDCCTLSDEGKVKAILCQYRFRQMNPEGGIGVVNISCKNEKIVEYSRKLLEKIGYTGPAQVEWLKTKEGEFKLLEINARFWGTLELSIFAGINFPILTLKMLKNKLKENNDHKYLQNLKERWIFPYELLSVIKDRENYPSRFSEYLNFLELFKSNVKTNIKINDLKPHIMDFLSLIEEFKNFLIKKFN